MTTTSISTTLLSKKGMKELKKSVAKLERNQAHIIAELHNLDKIDTQEQRLTRVEKLAQLEIIEGQLADSQLLLKNARLFPRKREAIKVALGSVVELIDRHGRIFRYMLVDSVEANPTDGRISVQSPLGKNLIGKTLRDTVEWTGGLRTQKLILVRILS